MNQYLLLLKQRLMLMCTLPKSKEDQTRPDDDVVFIYPVLLINHRNISKYWDQPTGITVEIFRINST